MSPARLAVTGPTRSASVMSAVLASEALEIEACSPDFLRLGGGRPAVGLPLTEFWRDLPAPLILALQRVLRDDQACEVDLLLAPRAGGAPQAGPTPTLTVSAAPWTADPRGAPRIFLSVVVGAGSHPPSASTAWSSEDRLEALLAASADGHFERDLRTNEVLHSARFNEILGNPPVATRVSGDSFRARIHPADYPSIEPLYADVLAGRLPQFDARFRIACAGGAFRWVRSRGKIVGWDAEGRAQRLAGTLTDIEAQVGAEQALQRSEARFAAAARAGGVGVFEVELPSGAAWRSGEHARIFDVDPSASWSFAQFREHVLTEDWPAYELARAEAERSGRLGPVQLRIRTAAGVVRWIELEGQTETDPEGRVTGLSGTVRDITEAQASLRALRESEAQLRAVLAAMPEGVVVADQRGIVTYCNAAAERITGVPALDFVGRTAREQAPRTFHAGGAPFSPSDYPGGQALATGRSVRDVLMAIEKPEGPMTWALLNAEPILDESGRARGVITTLSDVTEQRNREARLAAQDRVLALSRTVGRVGHEINNPLAAALLETDTALEALTHADQLARQGHEPVGGVLTGLLDEARTALGNARQADRRVAEVVREFSWLGKLVVNPRPVSLAAALEDAVSRLPPTLRARLALEVDDRGAPDVVGSVEQISRVLQELLQNSAWAATRPANNPVHVTLRATETHAVVEVRDEGCGMTPEDLEHIFEPFYATRRLGEGMGLGLAIALAIVTAHEGRLIVERCPGTGASFRMELPLHRPQVQ